MAQRLVRRICDHCKEEVKPSKHIEQIILESLKRVPQEQKNEMKLDEKNGIKIYQGKGCEYCNRTGMRGRVAVFEVVKVTDRMKKIIEEGDIHADSIWEEFYHQGAITMREDGILKVVKGVTTMEEVERATADTSREKTLEQAEEEKEQIV
jgi:type IV pilus assembly protein PilB